MVRLESSTDRTNFLETEYQQKLGFDVILQFVDTVEITEKTIEQIEINNEEVL